MNISGSDISKEAASMILLDDNFASTVRGIAEGRLIFVNLKKSIQYTISHSTPEVIPNLLYVIVPIPLPLSAILILVIDLGFELIAALSFAWDPPETADSLMKLPPRKPVTPATCEIFRRRALRKTRSHFDEEAGVVITPENETRYQRYSHNVRQVFTKQYWTDRFENTGAEVLVDGPLLSWAYLEIGLLESVGALFSFFFVMSRRGVSPRDAYLMQKGAGPPTNYWTKDAVPFRGIDGKTQADILAEAQSMYYWGKFKVHLMIQEIATNQNHSHHDNANVQPVRLQDSTHTSLWKIHVCKPSNILFHPWRSFSGCLCHLHAWRRSGIQDYSKPFSSLLAGTNGIRFCAYWVRVATHGHWAQGKTCQVES
jgi:hypothetical protein